MIHRLQRLFLLTCFSVVAALPAQTETPDQSAWLGAWSAELPGYGVIAVNISETSPNQALNVEVWWLFYELMHATDVSKLKHSARPRVEDGMLIFDRLDHTNTAALPGLAFRLVSPSEMKLASHGVFAPIMAPVWANLIFKRDPTGKAWFDRHENSHRIAGWILLGRKGESVPVPATWPAEIVVPTALLFSSHSSIFAACLSDSNVPAGFLRQAAEMADKGGGPTNFTGATYQALAANPRTPVDILDKIWASSASLRLWYIVAAHPNARPEWSGALVDRVMSGDESLRSAAAMIEVGPEALFRRLVTDGTERRGELAGNPDLSDDLYVLLAEKYLPETAAVLAGNPGVPVRLLEALATMNERAVDLQLILNPALPRATQRRLVEALAASATPADYDRLVGMPFAPPAFLAKCAASPSAWIRIQAAVNDGVDEATLGKLAEDRVRTVAKRARELLHERFPAAYAARQAKWRPLSELADELVSPLSP